MAPIGIAIIGAGIFVREEHKPAVEACKDFELKAIYSKSKKSAESLLKGSSVFDVYSDDSGPGKGLDALLARDDIKAVIIALPILVQPEVIKKALSAGKHVLSEKPIAPDLAAARELIKWRRSNIPATTNWSVAENVRFCETWRFARRSILSLGRILNFSVEASCLVAPGGKWYETEWRKTPSHQGGFLLDGGVHHTAGIILLLGEEDVIEKVAAFSAQVQSHLPPVDTVSAVLRTKKGVTGWLGMSFGTTFDKFEFSVACEGGVVTAMRGKVIVKRVGKEAEETLFPDDKAGVAQEVEGFAQALIKGEADKRQTPELALGDLELLEKMLLSGQQDGATLEVNGGF